MFLGAMIFFLLQVNNIATKALITMELVAEPVLIRTFNNPAEIVRICKKEMGKVIPVLRNGVDEIYVMDYESYLVRKECFLKAFETSYK